jgi:hypothetical protein
MHRHAAFLLLIALAACTHSAGRPERVPARLVLQADTARVELPDTVERGRPFTVTVTTFAGGCRRESAGTEVSVSGMRAEVRPYHSLVRSPVCTDDLLYMPHTARIRFDRPGIAIVRITGTRNRVDFGDPPEPITIERRVVVVR